MTMGILRPVARVTDVPEGCGIAVDVEGMRIALFNVDGEFKALGATCSQHGAPLASGVLHEGRLQCPWHGVSFDVERGICAAFPMTTSATTYTVRVEGDTIFVEV
jgi:nitrite reductase/ring-hydroxylating ferredoxin subunit